MAAVTRLGLYGGPRSPYGSFSGKAEVVEASGVFLGTFTLTKTMPGSTTLKKTMPPDTNLERQ